MRLTRKTKSIIFGVLLLLLGALFPNDVKYYFNKLANSIPGISIPKLQTSQNSRIDGVIYLPDKKYPKTIDHIRDAIAEGKTDICTIDRSGADQNRHDSLKGIPTKKGYDRDEYPMAMCAEGGRGADIRYIVPKDNRGAGSWIANQLTKYPDGSRIQFK